MALRTISWMAEKTKIAASTWRKATNREPQPFPAVREGKLWFIDDSTPEVQVYIKTQLETKAKGRGRKPKAKAANNCWWLVEQQDADMLSFSSKEEAERWASKLKVKSKIYQAKTRNEAWEQHKNFLIHQTRGLEF